MNYDKTLTLTWLGNTLVDVDHPDVDDIGWDSLYVRNDLLETKQEFNDKLDRLNLLYMGVKDDSQKALDKAYSDCHPEEPNSIVYVARHKDDTVEILTDQNDPDRTRFIHIINLAQSNQLNNLYQVDIEDDLL